MTFDSKLALAVFEPSPLLSAIPVDTLTSLDAAVEN